MQKSFIEQSCVFDFLVYDCFPSPNPPSQAVLHLRRIDRRLNNPLQRRQAVRSDAARPHQSLPLMVSGRHLLSFVVPGRLVREKHWPHASFPSTAQHFFFMLQSLAQRFKKKNNQKNAQLVSRIKVSQLAVECTARPAVNNKKQKKQLCNVFRGSDGRFGCHLDYLFIFQTSAFSSRGASDNDVSDWVTFECSVFKPYWLWGIQVGVIQVHGLLIQRINFTARCVCSAMQRWCRKSLSCIPHLLKRYIKFPQVS